MKVNRYQFDSIAAKTKKEIRPILRGEETGIYFEYLALIEILMHQYHSKYGINGRQAKEILQLVLFDVKGIEDRQEYDCTKWEEDCYRVCADGIEELFLPEKNEELQSALKETTVLDDSYFEFPRKVLIRIYESIEQWTKDFGPYGYFKFINEFMGTEIKSSKKFLVENEFLKQ